MEILVCVKQVPDTTEVKLDPKTNTLIRDGVPSIINPDDKAGIEAALQLREKLNDDFEEDIIDDVIDFLKKYNFINDNELASKIVNTNVNLNKYGKNKIKQNLYNKGIEKSAIDEAISEINQEDEFENALYLAEKRYARVKNEDPKKAYAKVANHLAYKGFNYDIIKSVLNKIFKSDYNDY